ncbi:MAG TPA: PorT family protein [Bacteroidetes bacterium]|nr:PorT family protein [Bacteroidota bacterium]
MKNLYFLAFNFLFCLPVFGQSGIPVKLVVYPNYSQAVYSHDGSMPSTVVNSLKDFEIAKPSFSTGILARLPLNENWGVSSGVIFMQTGFRDKEQVFRPGIPDPVIPEKYKATYRNINIEMPIYLDRSIWKNEKRNIYFSAGPSAWFNVSNKIISTSTYSDGRVEKLKTENRTVEFKGVNVALKGGIGLEYFINKKFSFYIQPSAQISLLGIALDAPLNRHILSYGITTGIILK